MMNEKRLKRVEWINYLMPLLLILVWSFLLLPMSAQAQWTSSSGVTSTTDTVGVGTTGPDRKVDILDSANPQLRLTFTDSSVFTDLQTLSSGQFIINPSGMDINGTKPFSVSASSDAFRFYTTADSNLRWAIGTDSTGLFNIAQRGNGWADQGTRFTITRVGNVGIGTTAPGGRLTLFGNLSSAAWGINGIQFRGLASTYTDTSSTGTVADIVGNSFAAPTFAASNSTTYTTASTLYIAGSPIPSTNVTITNPLSLNVATGNSYFGGKVGIGVTNQAPKLAVYGGVSSTTVADIFSASNLTALPLRVRNNSSASSGNLNQGAAIEFALQKTINGVESTQTGAVIKLGRDSDWVAADESDTDGNLTFFTVNNGTLAEAMRINSAGNIGIGTSSPAYRLDVAGQISSSTGGFVFPDGSVQTTAAVTGGGGTITGVTAGAGLTDGGTTGAVTLNVGAGAGLTVAADSISVNYGSTAGTAVQGNTSITVNAGTGMSGGGSLTLGSGGSLTLTNTDLGSSQPIFKSIANAGGTPQFAASVNNDALRFEGTGGTSVTFNAATKKVTIDSSTSSSAQNVSAGQFGQNTGGGNYSFPGDITVAGNLTTTGAITGGTINARYQDVAEWVPSRQKLAGGTVVILDPDKSNQVIASKESYDTRVAGVVSDQPGLILGQGGEGKVKVATTGRVKVKVDASGGAIKIGDLLVTSDKEGVAMKSEPINFNGRMIHSPGTIIGKALEPLEKGEGEILVLLSLQ